MSLVNEIQPISPLALSPYRYPTGWFVVAWSSDVAPGEVKRLHYFRRELVCFRTDGGEVSVLDAYCQHLGGTWASAVTSRVTTSSAPGTAGTGAATAPTR
jgi:Rieske [2Fe-2S] domain